MYTVCYCTTVHVLKIQSDYQLNKTDVRDCTVAVTMHTCLFFLGGRGRGGGIPDIVIYYKIYTMVYYIIYYFIYMGILGIIYIYMCTPSPLLNHRRDGFSPNMINI